MKDGSPDDCLRQIIVLAEELLNLLIIIIGRSHDSVVIIGRSHDSVVIIGRSHDSVVIIGRSRDSVVIVCQSIEHVITIGCCMGQSRGQQR